MFIEYHFNLTELGNWFKKCVRVFSSSMSKYRPVSTKIKSRTFNIFMADNKKFNDVSPKQKLTKDKALFFTFVLFFRNCQMCRCHHCGKISKKIQICCTKIAHSPTQPFWHKHRHTKKLNCSKYKGMVPQIVILY